MKHKYIECECGTPEHTLRFSGVPDADWPEMYVSVYLNDYLGFFKRLWHGVKYIFGFKSKYGHFDETILNKEKVLELRNFCDEWLDEYK